MEETEPELKKAKIIDDNENEEEEDSGNEKDEEVIPEIGGDDETLPEKGEGSDGGYLRTQKGNLSVRGVDMSEEVDSSWVSRV